MLNTATRSNIPLSRVARRKEKTRRTLFRVARQLFSEKGIYWAKVEDITELADLGKGTFYKYFDSKETIIRVLLEEGLAEVSRETEEAVRAASSATKILGVVIGARVDFFLRHPDFLLLFHQVRGLMQLQVGAAQELRDVYDGHLRWLAHLLKPALAPGSHSAREIATALAAYTSGLLTYQVLFDGHDAVTRRRDSLVRDLERSLQGFLKPTNGPSAMSRPTNGNGTRIARRGRVSRVPSSHHERNENR